MPALAAVAAAAGAAAVALRPRGTVLEPLPVAAAAHFSEAELERARRFARPQIALFAVRSAAGTAALAAVARRGVPGGQGPAGAAAAGALTSLAVGAASLPLGVVARRRALSAGLATNSWRAWAADQVKAAGLGTVMAGAGAAAADGLQRHAGERWWVPAAGLSVVVAAGSLVVGPLVLHPLFNTFTPLPAGPARDDVLDLAARARVRVGSVLTVDASRRTTAANAYVTGLGPTKRVVLFDTLLEHFSRDEVRLVIAHELAHVRERDVLRGLAFAAATAPAGALAVARLADRLAPAPGGRAAALALAASMVGAPIGLLSRGLSRRIEARADTLALQLTDAPDACIAFERRIALRNLADPDPPRWVRALVGTHPSVVERIGIAEAYAAAPRPRAA
jgi:STE24 endopeptidase